MPSDREMVDADAAQQAAVAATAKATAKAVARASPEEQQAFIDRLNSAFGTEAERAAAERAVVERAAVERAAAERAAAEKANYESMMNTGIAYVETAPVIRFQRQT